MVGRRSPPFWYGNFSGAMLNFGGVTFLTKPPGSVGEWVMPTLVRPAADLACRQRAGTVALDSWPSLKLTVGP